MTTPAAAPGQSVDAIDTPALVLDRDALERNLASMATLARVNGVALRPHAKTHKSAHLADRQRAHGAVGICVQKVDEAVALVRASDAPPVSDLLVTNEILHADKLDRLLALARNAHGLQRLGLVVDSVLGVACAAAAWQRAGQPVSFELLVEINVGQGRCGVAPAASGDLAQAVVDHGLRLAGLQAYHGGAQHLRRRGDREQAVHAAGQAVAEARRQWAMRGLPIQRVTGGGTGTAAIDAASGVWQELQAGSYVFMDRDYADNERLADEPSFEHALYIKSRVISRGSAHAVIDAGHKAHALDSGGPRVANGPWTWLNAGDEHGRLEDPTAAGLPSLQDTVWLVPGHCDPTVNLHDSYVVVEGGLEHGHVAALWPVHARGCVR